MDNYTEGRERKFNWPVIRGKKSDGLVKASGPRSARCQGTASSSPTHTVATPRRLRTRGDHRACGVCSSDNCLLCVHERVPQTTQQQRQSSVFVLDV